MVQFNNNLNQINEEIFCVIDLETTGTDPLTDRIIEIAVIVFKGDQVLNSFDSLIKSDTYIPPLITDLTGISNNDLENAPEFDDISRVLIETIKDIPIIGHNVDFDLSFLRNYGMTFELSLIHI